MAKKLSDRSQPKKARTIGQSASGEGTHRQAETLKTAAPVLSKSALGIDFLLEAYRHGKPIAAIGNGSVVLDACGLDDDNAENGVIVGNGTNAIEGFL